MTKQQIIAMTEKEIEQQRGVIASLLKSQRIYLQLTQEQVAERAEGKLSSRTIQRGEAGHWLGFKQMLQWCAALGINIATIMTSQVNNID